MTIDRQKSRRIGENHLQVINCCEDSALSSLSSSSSSRSTSTSTSCEDVSRLRPTSSSSSSGSRISPEIVEALAASQTKIGSLTTTKTSGAATAAKLRNQVAFSRVHGRHLGNQLSATDSPPLSRDSIDYELQLESSKRKVSVHFGANKRQQRNRNQTTSQREPQLTRHHDQRSNRASAHPSRSRALCADADEDDDDADDNNKHQGDICAEVSSLRQSRAITKIRKEEKNVACIRGSHKARASSGSTSINDSGTADGGGGGQIHSIGINLGIGEAKVGINDELELEAISYSTKHHADLRVQVDEAAGNPLAGGRNERVARGEGKGGVETRQQVGDEQLIIESMVQNDDTLRVSSPDKMTTLIKQVKTLAINTFMAPNRELASDHDAAADDDDDYACSGLRTPTTPATIMTTIQAPNSPSLLTTTATTPTTTPNGEPKRRVIATYFRENAFCSKDASWQTDFADDLDEEQEYGNDKPRDDQLAGIRKGNIGRRGQEEEDAATIDSDSGNLCGLPEFDDIFETNSITIGKSKATIRFTQYDTTDNNSTEKAKGANVSDLVAEAATGESKFNLMAGFRRLRNSLRRQSRHKPQQEPAPASEDTCLRSSGQLQSVSTYSDALDLGSHASKVKLTETPSHRHRHHKHTSGHRKPTTGGSLPDGDGDGRGGRKNLSHQSLHLSLDYWRLLAERNLVATLIGAYILVSLTIIIVLILPYVFNFPNSFRMDASDNVSNTMRDPISPGEATQASVTRLKVSQSTQTDDFRPPAASEFKPIILQREETDRMPIGAAIISASKPPNKTSATTTRPDELRRTPVKVDGGEKVVKFSKPVDESIEILAQSQTETGARLTGGNTTSGSTKRGVGIKIATAAPPPPPATKQQQQVVASAAQAPPSSAKLVKNSPSQEEDDEPTPDYSGKFDEMYAKAHNQQCQLLKVPTCAKSIASMLDNVGLSQSAAAKSALSSSAAYAAAGAVPWDRTLLLHQFSKTKQSQIEKQLNKFEPVIDIKCYPLMPLFLCSIYAPKCLPLNQTQPAGQAHSSVSLTQLGEKSTGSLGLTFSTQGTGTGSAAPATKQSRFSSWPTSHWSRLVPPCRSLCKEALRRCTFFFEVLSLRLIKPEDCDVLPESSNPDVCIGHHENNLLLKSTEKQTCQDDKFRCTDGGCIPKKWRCDGYADCTDRSDEMKCSKCNMETQFYCGQEICINKAQVCNGVRDCKDGRDERQCLRLSNETTTLNDQRQLEVWSAVDNLWVPVCGAHWSAMPMSHEACQALGYSRANSTTILYGPLTSAGVLAGRSPLVAPASVVKTLTLGNGSATEVTTRRRRSTGASTKSTGGWFDVTSGPTIKVVPVTASTPAPHPISPSTEMSTIDENSRTEQLVGIVEDVAVNSQSASFGRLGRFDHSVSYERQFSNSRNPDSQLAHIDAGEVKLRSITSMLYHGPQAGCADRPAQLVSSVYLQCQNFQCGRPVTSYSTRVRLLSQVVPVSAHNIKSGVKGTTSSLTPLARSLGSELVESVTGIDELASERRTPALEADEELESELDGGSGMDEQPADLPPPVNDTPEIDRAVSARLVVGGIESMPGEFPYLAALHGGPDEVFFCGGVLISINWLLTAAHCVGNRTQPEGWMVKVGVTRRIASPAFVRKLKVRKIIKHPEFNKGPLFNNDIALILLEESVEFNQYLRPICLPRAKLRLGPDNSKDCVVVGFGKSKFSQEANYLHVAHFVNVPIVHHATCSNWYSDYEVSLTEGMLCAGYAEGKRDACQGDSGSGLFCRYPNTNQFFVAGVVSFGIKCATPKLPGIYTSVPYYVDWIEATTREHGYPL